ncbi:unnamed protein product [Didymodactylos carnosus]|uniref:Uncharacterized protein n=1 Tax=Didymodactylos carnosus TaxID=1234261 RepID=A0A814Z6Q8_9BILA|nr:unnamed protein product [Didymodactylos carnosus]CAF1238942.1 unnamed protein product [Didymodactylos carnosus]CAF3819518.1 unnamed protein product [Didymodactylos carnosus]CAF4001108.1 unnamed protein product [Didymodactylos carnosus]
MSARNNNNYGTLRDVNDGNIQPNRTVIMTVQQNPWLYICTIVSFLIIIGLIVPLVIYVLKYEHCKAVQPTTTSTTITCIPVPNNGLLYGTNNPVTSLTYKYYSFSYCPTSLAAILTFSLRNYQSNWYLDDINMYTAPNNRTQGIVNGGFESGSTLGWENTGSCKGTIGTGTFAHSGNHYYFSKCSPNIDYLSQNITTIKGQLYYLDFWLYTEKSNVTNTLLNVTILS